MPLNLTCGVQSTVKHVLTECKNQQKLQEETLGSTHLFDILSPDPTTIVNLLNFLKKCNLKLPNLNTNMHRHAQTYPAGGAPHYINSFCNIFDQ